MKRTVVIGSGFSGLAASCFLAKDGHKVDLIEKNATIGGRARLYSENGFTFDMGPSWYWMPDVFDNFFSQFGKKTSDYYRLVKLDPGFQIIFGDNNILKVPAGAEELYETFESIEKGSADKLKKYLSEASFKYSVGMGELIYKPAYSWFEYMNMNVIKGIAKSHVFKSVSTYVRSYFKDERLIALMEFPVLFLGAMPNQIPALYSLMSHAALTQGTFYPMGGMAKIIDGMKELALSLGVEFHTNTSAEKIHIEDKIVKGIHTSSGFIKTNGIIAAADYHHVEQHLLEPPFRNYDESYWDKKVFAPSSLIYYIGVNKKLNKLRHHNLFFDTNFQAHADAIYSDPKWPSQPLFYLCCPSRTDDSVAPPGMENLFILIPVASGLEDSEERRQQYFNEVIARVEKYCGERFSENIIYKKDYCLKNFVSDYNAYKGNAYGLANTLSQTAVLKPTIQNKKVKNLFYAGQLTVPGPGVPPALISGQIAATELSNQFKKQAYETTI